MGVLASTVMAAALRPPRAYEERRMRALQVLPYANNYGKRDVNKRGRESKREERMKEETRERHPRGGLYFDDFIVGHLYEHRLRRTVTQMDNMLFSNMTLNPQPLHIDRHFCEQETEWGQPLMNSLFTLGLMIGISVNDLTVGTTIANLGMEEVKFPHPLFENDTVHCTTEILGKRESKSRPDAGIVQFHHRAYNQDDKLVADCRRQAFMRLRPR
jgi:acyl dehydratase